MVRQAAASLSKLKGRRRPPFRCPLRKMDAAQQAARGGEPPSVAGSTAAPHRVRHRRLQPVSACARGSPSFRHARWKMGLVSLADLHLLLKPSAPAVPRRPEGRAEKKAEWLTYVDCWCHCLWGVSGCCTDERHAAIVAAVPAQVGWPHAHPRAARRYNAQQHEARRLLQHAAEAQ
jgi:hypothetical protein